MFGINWIQAGIGAVAAFALSFLINTVIVDGINADWAAKLAAQKTDLENQCKADQEITKGANDALQNKFNDISNKLAAAKRVRPARCIIPAPTGKADMAAIHGEYAGQNGIGSEWLSDFGATCEEIRQTALTCEKFVDDTWKEHGQ